MRLVVWVNCNYSWPLYPVLDYLEQLPAQKPRTDPAGALSRSRDFLVFCSMDVYSSYLRQNLAQ